MRVVRIGHLNVRQPWRSSAPWQTVCAVLAVVGGALLAMPWWWSAWTTWTDAQQTAQALVRLNADTEQMQQRHQALRQKTAQHMAGTAAALQAMSTPLPAVTQALTRFAERENLALTLVDWEAALPVASLKASPVQQVPVHVQLQGDWAAWMGWWTQLPQIAPRATLYALDLQAQPQGGWRADVVLRIPQRISQTPMEWQLAAATLRLNGDVQSDVEPSRPVDPTDTRAWQFTQSQQAQQHPSFSRWMAPELQRTRGPLEVLARDRLHYVGHISQGGGLQALLRWGDVSGATPHAPIHRVAVGDYVGQDFGRVQTITTEQLTLRELVRNAQGVWQPRAVTLLLEDGAK